MSRKSDSNWRVLTDHDYKSSGVDHCPISAKFHCNKRRKYLKTWSKILYKWSNSPLQQMKLVAGVGIEPTQAFSVSRLWALHLTIRLPHDVIWWAHQGLNLGPTDYESGALTNWAIGPNKRDLRELNPLRAAWQADILTVWPKSHCN